MLNLEYLAELARMNQDALDARVQEFSIGGKAFAFNSRSHIMGVINLSSDSWYRESVCLSTDAAVARAKVLNAQGADIVDVGAESTLAHAAEVSEAVQGSRLLPVIQQLRNLGILVSAETYHAKLARASLEAGANVINLTGTKGTDDIYRMAADHKAAVIICYVQGEHVRAVGDFDLKHDPVGLMYEYFAREIERANKCGMQRVLIDPGLGFYYRNLQDSATRVAHQMSVFVNTFRLRKLGYPVCHALPHAFEYFREEVRSAEGFFAVLAALGKTDLFRTHEVARVKAVLDTLNVLSPGARRRSSHLSLSGMFD